MPVKAASEIIELESHVTTINLAKDKPDKYAFLSTLSIIKWFVPKYSFANFMVSDGVLIEGITKSCKFFLFMLLFIFEKIFWIFSFVYL